jgi:hypothetical protein
VEECGEHNTPLHSYGPRTVIHVSHFPGVHGGYEVERTPPRDKHENGIAERTVGIIFAKANVALLAPVPRAPQIYWCGLKDPWTWTLGKGKDGTSEKQICLVAYKGS